MDANLKQKWVEALRSGEFKQGRGQLLTNDHYCCLGVLCVIAGFEINPDGKGVVRARYEYDPIWAATGNEEACRTLASMNDSGDGFPEIADWIEANL